LRPQKVSGEAVADALVERFRRDGYAGASLRDLAADTGLKPASLYHRFPAGKPDLALAALARAGESFGQLVLAPLAGGASPAERLRASADGVARFYSDGALACVLAVLALSDAPMPVRERIAAMLGGWRAVLAATLAQAGADAAEAEAGDRIAAVQGALVLRRAGADLGDFARAVARMGAAP